MPALYSRLPVHEKMKPEKYFNIDEFGFREQSHPQNRSILITLQALLSLTKHISAHAIGDGQEG